MKNFTWIVIIMSGIFVTEAAIAADGTSLYNTKCAACHGPKGQGMKGMAPALKGNELTTKGDVGDIKKVILEGRTGKAKKYKDMAIDMPKTPMSDTDVDALVKFLQGELQK